jgi:DNA-binding IclR family transcriptional regulator
VIHFAEPIEADVLRIRHEFLEAPGLRLSAATAARLVGVSLAHASELLEELEQEGFLMRTGAGVYRRAEPSMA